MTKGERNKREKKEKTNRRISYFQSVMAMKRIFRNPYALTMFRKSVNLTKLRWVECFFFNLLTFKLDSLRWRGDGNPKFSCCQQRGTSFWLLITNYCISEAIFDCAWPGLLLIYSWLAVEKQAHCWCCYQFTQATLHTGWQK